MSTQTITDAERSKNWRKANPEKAAQLQDNTTKNRRARKEKDPEFAEDVRRRAREAMDDRRKRAAEGAPDGWKVVVRLAGEKRARGLVEIKYTDNGAIRGLQRQRPGNMQVQAFETREAAEEIVQRLLQSFPDKVEVAKVSVI